MKLCPFPLPAPATPPKTKGHHSSAATGAPSEAGDPLGREPHLLAQGRVREQERVEGVGDGVDPERVQPMRQERETENCDTLQLEARQRMFARVCVRVCMCASA